MAFGLGPRATRVYEALRRSIAGGELPPGTKLPAHTELAQQYGVAPLTMRRRWPDLALGIITRSPADLAGLHGTRESPVLLLAQPFSAHQVAELLRLALPPPVAQEDEVAEASGGRPR